MRKEAHGPYSLEVSSLEQEIDPKYQVSHALYVPIYLYLSTRQLIQISTNIYVDLTYHLYVLKLLDIVFFTL